MLNYIVLLLLRVTTRKKLSQTSPYGHLHNMDISVLRTNDVVLAVKPEFIQSLHQFYSLMMGHLACMQRLPYVYLFGRQVQTFT